MSSRRRPKTGASERGFTYLWALFTVALLGVSSLVTAELWTTAAKREREKELMFVGRQFREAIGRYYESTQGRVKQYPASLEELLDDARYPIVRRHLRKLYRDPMTGEANWGLVRMGGRIVGVHSLSGEAPLKSGGFLLMESEFEASASYSEWVFVYPFDLKLRGGRNVEPEKKDRPFSSLSAVYPSKESSKNIVLFWKEKQEKQEKKENPKAGLVWRCFYMV
ncbi:MAG: type II secretion system GspH family protein [Candidatus Accumulibacter sp.]|jgi:type II secretory pathway pseudopilin PulG|nr:type II secretion system GspH family protein [Accumulibacter sp.]